MTAKFITIEGIEGVGKSTNVTFLQQYLTEKNIPYICTREPGGTPIAEEIRQLLLHHHEEEMASDTELLLFFAGRAQHIATKIKPALEKNLWVICDRFTDASFAYQSGGRGINAARINMLENWVQGDLQPDLTLLLTAPVELALSRSLKRGEPDRIEKEEHAFFERVQTAYLARAKQFSHRFRIIDASGSLEDVQQQMVCVLDEFLSDISNEHNEHR